MLGFEFDCSLGEPFSVYNMVQAFTVFIFELLEAYIDTQSRYIVYTVVIGVIGFGAALKATSFQYKAYNKIAPARK